MGVDNQRGMIAAGKQADLILVDGDPTRRIEDIRRVRLVMKGGTLYDPAEIEAALGIAPRRDQVPESVLRPAQADASRGS